MDSLNIDFNTTALVIIDLQKGIVGMVSEGQQVVEKTVRLVEYFRKNEGFIAFVNVDYHDGKDNLKPITDNLTTSRGALPEDWAEFVPELEVGSNDYTVTKRQWGAFFGTDLDLQLRRRGINTIVLCGIATNIGVEMTAREAFQHGYNQLFITDAMTTFSKEEHEATCKFIFPRIGRGRTVEELMNE
ncbi:isochorismatase family protein [Niallia nealsonii]|uniref:Isochorismatase n=1 Tax=Niallia nealsonii TaxID=115979 RepID=A0A2N0YZF5_9BACI|nr:isochorismatase family protein [Niallia nealsonii]PKG22625.1 isochorismatase [Niallia nealsonii]